MRKCSFCGKSQILVDVLLTGGPTVAICCECVELATGIVASFRQRQADGDAARAEPLRDEAAERQVRSTLLASEGLVLAGDISGAHP